MSGLAVHAGLVALALVFSAWLAVRVATWTQFCVASVAIGCSGVYMLWVMSEIARRLVR